MTLQQRLTELIQACFSGLWIESQEHEDAQREIAQLCRDQEWRLATWNLETGLAIAGQTENPSASTGQDPLAVLRALQSLCTPSGATLLVLENFHRFLQSTEVIQALIQQIQRGKQHRTFLVILAPVVNIPVELEKLFIVIEHELPSRDQLADIARQIATEPTEIPSGREWETVLDAAARLTRYEALKIADAMAPCVLLIDEVEKVLSGASGMSSRLFGTMLSWLNDHTSDVSVVCTANDVSR